MDSRIAVRQLKKLERMTPKIRLAAEWKAKWKVLIATILSAQNRDEETIRISDILFRKFSSPAELGKARVKQIEKIIRPINYYRTKARHIKQTAKMVSENGIPKSFEGLLELPGVGRKVANVYLAVAHQKDVIGVDTHVARISKKLGWTDNTKPEKVEKDLEKLFPKRYWRSINYILVRFGQTYGKSRKNEDEILGKLIN